MSWKIILGKPDNTYIIGKRWVKKNIPKSNKIPKPFHENPKFGDIYYIGKHYTPENPNELLNLWVCMETGKILTSAPKLKSTVRAKPKEKPKSKVKTIEKPLIKKKTIISTPEPEPVPIPEPEELVKTAIIAKKNSATTLTPVSEVKGIGKAAYEKLSEANIKTVGDLISKHSQEIASLIGRKSDSQIKKWQENAREMMK